MKQDLTTINNLYTTKYEDLKLYALKAIKMYKRRYKPEVVISESYIYVTNKEYKKILTPGEIEGEVKKYIKNNIVWSNGFLNKEQKTLNNINNALQLEDVKWISSSNTLYDGTFIEELIEEYKINLNNIDRRLFDMYYYKDINTVEKVRTHLSIGVFSASETLRDCVKIYEGLRTYIKNKRI
jgi:hypothetical protein